MAGLGIFSFVFFAVVLFFSLEAGTDLNVDRENTESSVFNFVEYFCYSGAFSPAGNMSKIEAPAHMCPAPFQPVCWKGIIRWMLWPGLLSELLLLM